jgi:hypothetical protein
VGHLVGQEVHAEGVVRREPAGRERDVLSDGERLGAQIGGGAVGLGIVVDADVAEVGVQAGLEALAGRGRQRRACGLALEAPGGDGASGRRTVGGGGVRPGGGGAIAIVRHAHGTDRPGRISPAARASQPVLRSRPRSRSGECWRS